jgi:hypothetical protein
MTGQIRCKVRFNADGANPRATAAMRNTESTVSMEIKGGLRLMEVEMAYIRSQVSRIT